MKTYIVPDIELTPGEPGTIKTTITPQAGAAEPLKPSLADPEDAFTIQQVREQLIEMEAELEHYPVNLSRGPGLVRGMILAVLDRGITASDIERERDALQIIAANCCLRIVGLEIQRDQLRAILEAREAKP